MIGANPRVETDALAVDWESALDAATRAVDAGRGERVSAGVIDHERRRLTQERHDVGELLHWLATNRGHATDGWLPPRAVTPHMLGLPGEVRAIVFDLEGVLTDSDVLHAAAWAEALDPVLMQLSHDLGWPFVPFALDGKYRLYFDGRPRLEGIRLFFAGRGIRLPEGGPTDREDVPTLYGVSRHKGTLLE